MKKYTQKPQFRKEFRIPLVNYFKRENKRYFFFKFLPNVYIDSGIYYDSQVILNAFKQLLQNQSKLVTTACINKQCPVCFEPIEANIKRLTYIFSCKHSAHLECAKRQAHQFHYSTCPLCRGQVRPIKYLIVDKDTYLKTKSLFEKLAELMSNKRAFQFESRKRFTQIYLVSEKLTKQQVFQSLALNPPKKFQQIIKSSDYQENLEDSTNQQLLEQQKQTVQQTIGKPHISEQLQDQSYHSQGYQFLKLSQKL